MKLTSDILFYIVAQSTFLQERIDNNLPPEANQDEQELDKKLHKWCETVAEGDVTAFQKRMALYNLEPDYIRSLLGKIKINSKKDLPGWVEIFKKFYHLIDTYPVEKILDLASKQETSVPFKEIYMPFIITARKELLKYFRADEFYTPLVQCAFEKKLLKDISFLCEKAIYLEFSIFRIKRESPLMQFLIHYIETDEKELYNDFIKNFLQDKFLNFFLEYPLIARLVSHLIKYWIESVSEFIQRLKADLPEISATFNNGKSPGKITDINPCLSDSHNYGKTVIYIAFKSGLKLIYKPKNLSLEKSYWKLIEWFNENGIPIKLKHLRVINRHDYGWVEFAKHIPCNYEQQIKKYYERAGELLCILYVLGGVDFHYGNIISNGEYPVPVDLETLLQPGLRSFQDKKYEIRANFLATKQFWNSVLKSGLLPRWQYSSDGKSYDISGLAGIGGQILPFQKRIWKNLSSDSLNMELEYERMKQGHNIPVLNGKFILPFHFKDNIVNGFNEMYKYFIKNRDVLLKPHNPFCNLSGQLVRFVFRNTSTYGSLIIQSTEPEFLRDVILWDINIDSLTQILMTTMMKNRKLLWPLVKSEISRIQHFDIPYFTGYSDSNDLITDFGEKIKFFFETPGYDIALSNLKKLNKKDMMTQVSFIRSSLYTSNTQKNDTHSCEIIEKEAIPVNSEEALKYAYKIAKELKAQAIFFDKKTAIWTGYTYSFSGENFQLEPLGYNLYDGICGISLFFSALERIEKKGMFYELALSSINSLLKDLGFKQVCHNLKTRAGIGGATGIGSIIYSLVTISNLLDKMEIIDYAVRASSLITPDLIKEDRKFDIIGGSAGAILGLIKLYKTVKEKEILNKAILCGRHLLNNRSKSSSGYRAWKNTEDKILGGFSHGASGIAYALLCLYEITEQKYLLEAAKEAIDYENTLFSEENNNWLDLREASNLPNMKFMMSWCHGAPGIALARIGGLSVLDTTDIRKSIATGLASTDNYPLELIDHLCCGNMGRAEILFTAGLKLKNEELKFKGLLKAGQVLLKKQKTGKFSFATDMEQFHPGFFQGISGIGYELLRLTHYEILPSILLFE